MRSLRLLEYGRDRDVSPFFILINYIIKYYNMKRILLIILSIFILNNILIAQSHCGVPNIMITCVHDKHGRLSDSCDTNYNYFYFHYKKIPEEGYTYIVRRVDRKKYVFVFKGRKILRRIRYNIFRIECGKDVPKAEVKEIEGKMRIGTIPDTTNLK